MKNTATVQMELTMRSQIRNNFRDARANRLKRARWWFNRMREAVDFALPPRNAPAAPPTQTYLQMQQTDLLLSDAK
jgi:hypothetical protein